LSVLALFQAEQVALHRVDQLVHHDFILQKLFV